MTEDALLQLHFRWYLDLYVKNGSEEGSENKSARPKSQSEVLSVSLPPSLRKTHLKNSTKPHRAKHNFSSIPLYLN